MDDYRIVLIERKGVKATDLPSKVAVLAINAAALPQKITV
eukprot:SAG22_NODE_4053_length_1404_cov_1.580843_4_plen_39_part_01